MAWSSVIGQERVKMLVGRALAGGRMPHAYLFYGVPGAGMDAMALELARAINCTDPQPTGPDGVPEACDRCGNCRRTAALRHPDVAVLVPTKPDTKPTELREVLDAKAADPYTDGRAAGATGILIAQVREVQREASFRPLEGRKRIIVVCGAELLREEAANAVLKLLEEPPAHLQFLLTTGRQDQVLPTILSRCQPVRLDRPTADEVAGALVLRKGLGEGPARLLARLSGGSYPESVRLMDRDLMARRAEALEFLRAIARLSVAKLLDGIEAASAGNNRERVVELLDVLALWFRDVLVLRTMPDERNRLVNIDQAEPLVRFAGAYPGLDVEQAVAHLQEARTDILANVAPSLVLTTLSFRLHRMLQSATVAA